MPMTVKITSAGGIELGRGVMNVFSAAPDVALKYLHSAANDAHSRIKAKGIKYAKTRYAYADKGIPKTLKFTLDFFQAGRSFALKGIFRGKVGIALSRFKTKPEGWQSWRGVPNKSRKPKKGVKVQILRGKGNLRSQWHTQGHSLYFLPGGGIAARGAKVPAGPSPIQAIQKKENTAAIIQEAHEVYAKRIAHHADRMIQEMLRMR